MCKEAVLAAKMMKFRPREDVFSTKGSWRLSAILRFLFLAFFFFFSLKEMTTAGQRAPSYGVFWLGKKTLKKTTRFG